MRIVVVLVKGAPEEGPDHAGALDGAAGCIPDCQRGYFDRAYFVTNINRIPPSSSTPAGSLGGANAPWEMSAHDHHGYKRLWTRRAHPAVQEVAKLIWQLIEAEPVLLKCVECGILGIALVSYS